MLDFCSIPNSGFACQMIAVCVATALTSPVAPAPMVNASPYPSHWANWDTVPWVTVTTGIVARTDFVPYVV